jgi:hypothetical protein
MQKEARNRASDPAQEEVREAKSEWNEYCSELIAKLIYLKRGLNGRGEQKVGLPPSKIHHPIPQQVQSYLNDVKDTSIRVMNQADKVIETQNQYADAKMQSFMSNADDSNDILNKFARIWPHSWIGSQIPSGINIGFEGKPIRPWNLRIRFQETRPIRRKMMRSLMRLRDLLEMIEHYISSKDPHGIPKAINSLELLKEVTIITLIENLNSLKLIFDKKEPKQIVQTTESSEKEKILQPILKDLQFIRPALEYMSKFVLDEQYAKILVLLNDLEEAENDNNEDKIVKIYQILLKLVNKFVNKPIKSFEYYLQKYKKDVPQNIVKDPNDLELSDVDLSDISIDQIQTDLQYTEPVINFIISLKTLNDAQEKRLKTLSLELENAKISNKDVEILEKYYELLKIANFQLKESDTSFESLFNKIKHKIASFPFEIQKIAKKDIERLFNRQRLKLFSTELDSIKLVTIDFIDNIIKEIYKFLDVLEDNNANYSKYDQVFQNYVQYLIPLYKSAISLGKVYNSEFEDQRINKNFKDKQMETRKVPFRDLTDLQRSIHQLQQLLKSPEDEQ